MPKNNLATPAQTINVLTKYGLSLNKQYGQNFLVDNNILEKILKASSLSASDTVLEIGGGIGTLSSPLCKKAGFVHIVEIDNKFLPAINETLKNVNNYKVHSFDAMNIKCESFTPMPNKVVSNLPYNIAAPLVIKLLKECSSITSLYVMVQKEMAERFYAKPNSPNYSALSVKIQLFSTIKKLFDISANSFLPKPKVDSSFIRIIRKNLSFKDKNFLLQLIEDGFRHRRKKMIKSLIISVRYDESLLINSFKISRIPIEKRAQELTNTDFIALAKNYLLKKKVNHKY